MSLEGSVVCSKYSRVSQTKQPKPPKITGLIEPAMCIGKKGRHIGVVVVEVPKTGERGEEVGECWDRYVPK